MITPNEYKVIENVKPYLFNQCGFESKDGCYISKTTLYFYDGTKKPYISLYVLIDATEPYLVVQVLTDDGYTYSPFYNVDFRCNNKVYDKVVKNYNQYMDSLVEKGILERKIGDNNLNEVRVNIKKLNENVKLPFRGSEQAAGYDLYANEGCEIEPHKTALIGTGLAAEIPEGYFGAIFARSGLAIKQGLRPGNCVGCVDSDYRGEIKVGLHNDMNETKSVQKGDRIAQFVVIPYLPVNFVEVESLSDTPRGSGGFGSSGSK